MSLSALAGPKGGDGMEALRRRQVRSGPVRSGPAEGGGGIYSYLAVDVWWVGSGWCGWMFREDERILMVLMDFSAGGGGSVFCARSKAAIKGFDFGISSLDKIPKFRRDGLVDGGGGGRCR